MRSVEVVTVGEVMALLLAEPGVPLTQARRFDLQYAGAESNVAVGLARLGHQVRLLTRVGDDAFGRSILTGLRAEGVQVSAVVDPSRPTGMLMRDTNATGIAVDYHRAGSAATGLEVGDIGDVAGARLLHLTAITAVLSQAAFEAVLHAARTARAAGVAVSVDPNVRLRLAPPERWRRVIDALAPLADVLLIGSEDADAIGVAEPLLWARDHGLGTVVVKNGADGAVESCDGEVVSTPIVPVPVLDPVGAGDAFAAGWISGWLLGQAPSQRLERAAAVAACVVASRGDVPGLPDPAQLDRVLAGAGRVAR